MTDTTAALQDLEAQILAFLAARGPHPQPAATIRAYVRGATRLLLDHLVAQKRLARTLHGRGFAYRLPVSDRPCPHCQGTGRQGPGEVP